MGSNGTMGARLALAIILAAGVLSSPASGQVGNVKAPRKIKEAKPVYPRESLEIGDEGAVILELSVAASGIVEDARILWSRCQRLDKAAVATVRQWRYEHVRINGQAVPYNVVATVSFRRSTIVKPRAPLARACKWAEPPKPIT
jgi:TonB family protein